MPKNTKDLSINYRFLKGFSKEPGYSVGNGTAENGSRSRPHSFLSPAKRDSSLQNKISKPDWNYCTDWR